MGAGLKSWVSALPAKAWGLGLQASGRRIYQMGVFRK